MVELSKLITLLSNFILLVYPKIIACTSRGGEILCPFRIKKGDYIKSRENREKFLPSTINQCSQHSHSLIGSRFYYFTLILRNNQSKPRHVTPLAELSASHAVQSRVKRCDHNIRLTRSS